jgi:hypothetical protein
MHAIILGQRGASLSGRELAIARSVSAASKPPILRNKIRLMNISCIARKVLTYAHIVQSLLSPPLRPYHSPPLSPLSKSSANPRIAQQLRSKFVCQSTISKIWGKHRHTNSPLVSYEGKTIHSATTLSTVSESTCWSLAGKLTNVESVPLNLKCTEGFRELAYATESYLPMNKYNE